MSSECDRPALDRPACDRLLVANRGEIARRIFRTARAMGIETVAVHAEGDGGAPFVAEADQAVALGPGGPAETYLDGDRILAAATACGADAVHPGYGFLAESASFARAVIDAGLAWIGPSPEAIAAMGDKLAAKRLMIEAAVPVLPSAEIPVGAGSARLVEVAAGIGYPLLVKAAAGGGGRGMRLVTGPDALADAVAGASREAEAAFGDGTVFLERYLAAARHVEIQVLGDHHGTLVHCFERECSIQRRHQKVIEEAPSPAVDSRLRAAMGAAAVNAARAVGYHSAGTVEFLLADSSADFWFLEMNTRLQVEHAVTEAVTGLDLVREQIRIARGEPLGYGQDGITLQGHAIEARLYAEDPAAGFLPATGTVTAFAPPKEPPARFDSGVEAGTAVGMAFDPMLAKVIVHAPTREEAASRLAMVLDRTVLAGVTTNRAFLVDVLRHPEFRAGATTTDFIERTGVAEAQDPPRQSPAELIPLVVAAVLHRQAANRADAGVLAFLRPGHRNSAMPDETVTFAADGRTVTAAYRTDRNGECSFEVTVDGEVAAGAAGAIRARAVACDGSVLDAEIGGIRARYQVVTDGPRRHVQGPRGRVDLVEQPRFCDPAGATVVGGQVAPMPGTVRLVDVAVGDTVDKGRTLVVLEAMKMEHIVRAPGRGRVTEVRCRPGEQVATGDVLVVLEADPAD